MKYEVEMKFPVGDLAAASQRMRALGATIGDPQTEVDAYFAHPSRNFVETDEALRLRCKGASHLITYKGPKIDRATKTRHEIELPLPPESGTIEAWTGLLETLGFRRVANVCKSRRKAAIPWKDRQVEGSLDEVEGVGTYAELELVVEEDALDDARACVQSLAEALGFSESERRSYLELLLTLQEGP